MRDTGRRRVMVLAAVMLLAATVLACAAGGEIAHRKNAVRRAVVEYELEKRGPEDELMVFYSTRNDALTNLGFEGGNTVWLRDAYYAQQYMKDRDSSLSYLIIYDVEFVSPGGEARVQVIRGDSSDYTTRQLTLEPEGEGWVVVSDVEE